MRSLTSAIASKIEIVVDNGNMGKRHWLENTFNEHSNGNDQWPRHMEWVCCGFLFWANAINRSSPKFRCDTAPLSIYITSLIYIEIESSTQQFVVLLLWRSCTESNTQNRYINHWALGNYEWKKNTIQWKDHDSSCFMHRYMGARWNRSINIATGRRKHDSIHNKPSTTLTTNTHALTEQRTRKITVCRMPHWCVSMMMMMAVAWKHLWSLVSAHTE